MDSRRMSVWVVLLQRFAEAEELMPTLVEEDKRIAKPLVLLLSTYSAQHREISENTGL
jgi:hypothetical protein